ncbi:hypothetical protein V7S43_016653 [Phytophthora oleae]|uniref:SWIM-type domain-containing protein n=1 Tax=Phytophthora oleae TaxID=2107226 RepID=A0ABD3EZ73_9STRA
MSLHKVFICVGGHKSPQNCPDWTSSKIDIMRNGYACDCKTIRESGWICEHALATMSLLQRIDLDDVLRAIPVRNKPGCPRKSRSPLDQDTNDSHFFSINKLVKLLTDSPRHVLHWSVMKEFAIRRDDIVSNEYTAGRITGWQQNWVGMPGRYASLTEMLSPFSVKNWRNCFPSATTWG